MFTPDISDAAVFVLSRAPFADIWLEPATIVSWPEEDWARQAAGAAAETEEQEAAAATRAGSGASAAAPNAAPTGTCPHTEENNHAPP